MSVSVVWSGYFEEDLARVRQGGFARDCEFVAPSWARHPGNAETLAGWIAQTWFGNTDEWADAFGAEAVDETVWIEIAAPAAVAGLFEVTVERVVKAHARRARSAEGGAG